MADYVLMAIMRVRLLSTMHHSIMLAADTSSSIVLCITAAATYVDADLLEEVTHTQSLQVDGKH